MANRILVIDDSLTLRQFIRTTLNAQIPDAEVVLAKDGREGLTSAREESPDLILLDFILPDLRGDAVCAELLKEPRTASLPVVLMSSNVAEIARTQAEYANVVRGLAKPFKAELLCSTLTAVQAASRSRRGLPTAPEGTAAPESMPGGEPKSAASGVGSEGAVRPSVAGRGAAFELSGDLACFSALTVLLALEQERATGVCQIEVEGEGLELYVSQGAVVMLTCRNARRFLEGAASGLPAVEPEALEKASAVQAGSGCPVFLTLAREGLLPADEAAQRCLEQGWRLFAPAWSAARGRFHFVTSALPEFVAGRPGFRGSMTAWSLESLRRVRFEHLGRVTWCRSSGVPAFTRAGFERIQQISLNDDEVRFAELLQSPLTLEAIAARMNVSLEAAQHLLNRFVCLEICEFWPVNYLQDSCAA